MLSCKDVSQAVSESLDEKLPWSKRLSVKTHLLMCTACLQMARQLELLRTAALRYESTREEAVHPDSKTLSKEASARILARLSQAKNDPAGHE